MTPAPPVVMRPRRWLYLIAIAATLLFIAGTVLSHRLSGWNWVSIVFVGMSIFAAIGIVQVATSHITLSSGAIEFGSLWTSRRVAAADITTVTWAAGSGVSIKLTTGGWAKLPELGYNSQGLTNTLRAWLKRQNAGRG